MITTFIIRLWYRQCPHAIIWRITLVIVNALYRVFRGGAFTHILSKTHKRMFAVFTNQPTLAYCDAPPPVVFISFHSGITATGTNVSPNSVKDSVPLTVNSVRLLNLIVAIASTTQDGPLRGSQVAVSYGGEVSTTTTTVPPSSALSHRTSATAKRVKSTRGLIYYDQPTEYLTRQIYKFTLGLSHWVFSITEKFKVRAVERLQFFRWPAFILPQFEEVK